MDMPDKIWISHDELARGFCGGQYENRDDGRPNTAYVPADLAQSLADALEDLINDEGRDFIKSSAWDAARAALANYRKGE